MTPLASNFRVLLVDVDQLVSVEPLLWSMPCGDQPAAAPLSALVLVLAV
jgi:hypothetical protein